LKSRDIFITKGHSFQHGETLARLHADPVTTALVHPTRRNLYSTLMAVDEMSTVQLQTAVSVDRYNLYHHLKKLATLGLVENHRDVGRARWWKITQRVTLPGLVGGNEEVQTQSAPAAVSASAIDTTGLPESLANAISQGRDIHIVNLDGSREQIGAKKMLEALANDYGIELDLPFTFVPGGIALIGKER